jgi:uncharacterized protein (TIGR03545 family)
MRRFVRWRYLVPRLALLLVLLLVGQWVLGRVVRRTVVQSGERSVGAKVEIGGARLSLLDREISFRDLRVANPRSPLRNLVEADLCELTLEAGSLLHKQVVIDQGTIAGLRFGTARESSGALPGAGPDDTIPTDGWMDARSAAAARAWLDRLETQFNRELVDQFESIRVTEELAGRWPERSRALEDRVHELRQRTTKFQEQVRQAQANPLRHADFLERMPDEIAAIQRDAAALAGDVQQLPDLLESDRRAIVAARRHDAELLRNELRFEKIDANVLTAYLLEQQLSGPVADLLGWLRWIRRMVPADAPPPVADQRHDRGRDVVFRGCQQTPNWLIRALDVQGTVRFGGQTVELAGRATDVCSDPALHNQPLRLRLSTRGSLPLELQATIDRTGGVARDQLLIDCGGILIPKLRLGDSDKLRFSIEPTTASLNISVTLEGDRLSGDVQIVQKQAQITPSVGPELERFRLAAALDESLGRMPAIATRISLGGTIHEPRGRVWSNLGPAVAEAVDRAVERTAQAHAGRLLAAAQQRIDEQFAQLDRQIAERQTTLAPQLVDSNDVLSDLANHYDRSGRLSLEYLGRRLPENSLFR